MEEGGVCQHDRDPSQDCLPGISITSHPIRTCGGSHDNGQSYFSTSFSVDGMEYGQVCGRIKMDKRLPHTLTHGVAGERQHIWTFAAGNNEVSDPLIVCPCDTDDVSIASPLYVGADYFCGTGSIDGDPFFESDSTVPAASSMTHPG